MQRLIESHRTAVVNFLQQRDYGVLVVYAAGEQIGYAIQILRSIENDGFPDVFLPFAHDFESPSQFASLVAERIKASELAIRKGGAPQSGGIEVMPDLCTDCRQDPVVRLRSTLTYARALLPRNTGQRLVCAFLPLTISDPTGYGWLMRELITPDRMPPWYRGMRFILREDTAAPMIGADLPPFVQRHEMDFSAEAMEASLQQEAEDLEIGRENRAQALLQLASLDYARSRYGAALEKYVKLLGHSRQTANTTMQAVVVIGIGDVYQRMGDLPTARDWYTRAIRAACESKSPVVLFTLARNLGHVSFELQLYEDAERYFDSTQQLALHVHDPEAKILALEWRAFSQMQLSAYDRAHRSLSEALATAGEFEKHEHRLRIMERLQQLNAMT